MPSGDTKRKDDRWKAKPIITTVPGLTRRDLIIVVRTPPTEMMITVGIGIVTSNVTRMNATLQTGATVIPKIVTSTATVGLSSEPIRGLMLAHPRTMSHAISSEPAIVSVPEQKPVQRRKASLRRVQNREAIAMCATWKKSAHVSPIDPLRRVQNRPVIVYAVDNSD